MVCTVAQVCLSEYFNKYDNLLYSEVYLINDILTFSRLLHKLNGSELQDIIQQMGFNGTRQFENGDIHLHENGYT